MRKIFLGLTMIMLMCTQACTHQSWYEGLQQGQRNKCYDLPTHERENCLKQAETSYDEYQRQRQEVLGNTRQ